MMFRYLLAAIYCTMAATALPHPDGEGIHCHHTLPDLSDLVVAGEVAGYVMDPLSDWSTPMPGVVDGVAPDPDPVPDLK